MKMTPEQQKQQDVYNRVLAYIPQISGIVSVRTYKVKKLTGKHSTLVSLKKFIREHFTDTYKIPYDTLPLQYRNEIERMVDDAYNGMKEARRYE